MIDSVSPTLGTALAGPSAHKVLDSLLPGNQDWQAFRREDEGDCLSTCPAYASCSSGGPEGVCTSAWASATCTEATVDVIGHVLNNFEHYNRNKKPLDRNTEAVVGQLRDQVAKLLFELEKGVEEGTAAVKSHVVRERASRGLARKLKSKAVASGEVICEVCKVDFFPVLGLLSTAVMDAHHIKPLGKSGTTRTRERDLVLVCVTCHRLLHTKEINLDMHHLRRILSDSACTVHSRSADPTDTIRLPTTSAG